LSRMVMNRLFYHPNHQTQPATPPTEPTHNEGAAF
jgi:hypothetical protein